MVEATIRMLDANVSYSPVRASRGKVVRAEPIAALYEQGKIYHVGAFPALEDQMCAFTTDFDRKVAGYSPDRVDALVWALSDLFVQAGKDDGYIEWLRDEAMKLKQPAPPVPKTNYAVGSIEWCREHGVNPEDVD